MKVSMRDRYVLAEGVEFTPLESLPDETREQLGAAEGQTAVTRQGSRASAKVIDDEFSRLLKCFRDPSSIPEAIAKFARDERSEPDEIAILAYPKLRRFIEGRFLVLEQSALRDLVRFTYGRGDRIDEFQILRPLA